MLLYVLLTSVLGAPLTLDEAIEISLSAHEEPQIAMEAVHRAHAQYQGAYARLLPRIQLSGSVTRRPSSTTVGGSVLQRQTAWAATGTGRWTLIDFGAIPGIKAAARLEDAQHWSAEETRRSLAFATARQFYGILTAQAIRDASNQRVAAAQAAVKDARARVKNGIARRQDLTRAELELRASRVAQRQAQRDVEVSRIAFATLLGEVEPNIALRPLQAPEQQSASSGLSLTRPDVFSLQKRKAALSLQRWDNLAGFLPSLNLTGTVSRVQETGFVGRTLDWRVVLSVDWDLFLGGSRIWRNDEFVAQIRSAELEIQQREREATLGVREGQAELAAAKEALEISQTQVELAQDNADQVTELRQGGLGTALQQVDANTAVFDAQTQVAQHELSVALAQLKILERAGRWPSGEEPQL